VLGKLLGLNPQKSALPKNQIEVICPVCGAAQREPRLVVTTVCRKCGEHLRIEKRGVIASSQINPLSQEISPTAPTYQANEEDHSPDFSWQDSNPASAPPGESDVDTVSSLASVEPEQERVKQASALLPDTPVEDDIPPGLGSLVMGVHDQDSPEDQRVTPQNPKSSTPFAIASADAEAETDDDSAAANTGSDADASESSADTETASDEEDAEASEAAGDEQDDNTNGAADLPRRGGFRKFQPIKRAEASRPEPSTFQKMREQGFRQQHFKEVECFDCHHKFKVGRSARNSQCPACSSPICLEDIDINMTSTSPIRTRGDVYIRKMGNVSTSEIKCRDLNVQGIISASVECTGELTIRTAGTIVGEIHCVRLQVIKGSDIQLINTIYAKEVEIYARVCGNIHCDGPVLIGSGGCVEGDVTARSVNIEPGGHLDGGMNILRPPQKKAPADAAAQQNLPLGEPPEA